MSVSSVVCSTEYLIYENTEIYSGTTTSGSKVYLKLRWFDYQAKSSISKASDVYSYFDSGYLVDTSGNVSILLGLTYSGTTITMTDLNSNTDTIEYSSLEYISGQSREVG